LESVHKGLGEMQSLASSVGDLKKVLTNVKTRGTWGEIQLGNLLEQVLSPGQYEANVATKPGSLERVEFAIKLPGKDSEHDRPVWLPIDAKFPQEDYQRLVEAQEQANIEAVDKAAKQLEIRIKAEAKDIRDKYIDPPHTTDFGIMFLPTESLYAEVLRRPGLVENLQRDFRVVVTGPMTLAALLNSLQMGFRTIVIEKQVSKVWAVLGGIKQEFSKFGEILDRTKKKIEEAGNIIDEASSKSRNIQTKLKKVQELPQGRDIIEVQDKEEL
jgi:DNA recombination protein RmuC